MSFSLRLSHLHHFYWNSLHSPLQYFVPGGKSFGNFNIKIPTLLKKNTTEEKKVKDCKGEKDERKGARGLADVSSTQACAQAWLNCNSQGQKLKKAF